MKKIAITTGDPAGIGPEIAKKALRFIELNENRIFIVYGRKLDYHSGNEILQIKTIDEAKDPHIIYWIKIDDNVPIGKISPKAGEISYQILEKVAQDLIAKKIDAVVTSPISKEAIQKTHPKFIGHTEFFARKAGIKLPIMSFWGPHFNLALLTTHLPIKEISARLTPKFVIEALRIIHSEINRILEKPKIALIGLNPHAGENGAFGYEELMFRSVLKSLEKENIFISGPFPADTFFCDKVRNFDLVISAYHDQGLIPFKMISSEAGVNATLGLPFIRTSVDHGTAFDIAGKNSASEKSLLKAIEFAEELVFPKQIKKDQQYTHFAGYYDHFMKHVPYERWKKFILDQFNQYHQRNPENCLELACGTGNIANQLVRLKINVDATDISQKMLNIAAEKPFAPNLMNRDMTATFPTDHYELIILIFDSINYLTDIRKMKKLFQNSFLSLQKGGLFIFDIVTEYQCEKFFDGYLNLEDDPDNFLIHQGYFDRQEKLQITHFTFFKKKNFLFERFDEIHRQKVYLVDEIIELIKAAGFQLLGIFSDHNKKNLKGKKGANLDKNYNRLFFVLQK